LPLSALAVAMGLLWFASTCVAAGPITGGRYAAKTSTGGYVSFNVGDNGRAFVSNPRLVFEGSEISARCGLKAFAGSVVRPWDLGGSRRLDLAGEVTTVSDGTPVSIHADGRFGVSETVAPVGTRAALTLSGRFVSGGRRAKGSFRVSASEPGQPVCAERGTFAARFTGQRHFTHGPCAPSGVKLRAANGGARVYEQRYIYDPVVRNNDAPGAATPYGPGAVEYGCTRGNDKQWFLAGNDTSDGLFDYYLCSDHFEKVALARQVVGLALVDVCQPGVGGGVVRIVDLKTGAGRRYEEASVGQFPPPSQPTLVEILALAPSGSAAWIVCAEPQRAPCQVVEEVDYGPKTLLDQSDTIDPKSLTLDGTTLSWRNNGETRTATLS
jgi:hypothetical protein